jgi:hypothetical protein
MLTGQWARGVTAVEPITEGGTVRWESRDGNRFSLHVDPAGDAPRGRAERGVFFSVPYVSAAALSLSDPFLTISSIDQINRLT